jgi:hypothetical protein
LALVTEEGTYVNKKVTTILGSYLGVDGTPVGIRSDSTDRNLPLDGKTTAAINAAHEAIGDWPNNSVLFFFNPASGAVEVRPAHRDKVARSLARHARKMQRRLFIVQARLQIEYLALKSRYTVLVLLRNLMRFGRKTMGYAHE